MSEKLIYKPLPIQSSKDEILEILEKGNVEELRTLAVAVGETYPDWKFAQDLCLQLTEHSNEVVRANACLGLAYVARTKGQLEKHLVKPVLLRELQTQTEMNWRIVDALGDINFYLEWSLAH